MVLEGDPYASGTVGEIPALRRAAREAAPGTLVGGPTAQEYDLREAASRDTLVVIPAALAVVLAILVALLRSLAAPVVLLATVVASNLAALGLGVLLSEHVYDFAAIDPTLPLLGFFFLAARWASTTTSSSPHGRARRRNHMGRGAGCCAPWPSPGSVITAAGVVLAATFADARRCCRSSSSPSSAPSSRWASSSTRCSCDRYSSRRSPTTSATGSGGRREWRATAAAGYRNAKRSQLPMP